MAEPVGRIVKGFRFRCRAERAAGGVPACKQEGFRPGGEPPVSGRWDRRAGGIPFAAS